VSALELSNVTVAYRQQGRMLAALREVSLKLKPGQLYGLVGESGSGKSTLALAALRYLPDNARLMGGTVRLGGQDVYRLSRGALQKLWRERVKFVPQNPLPALSPSQRIRRQLAEAIRPQRPQQVPLERVLHALAQVGLADPKRVASSYPHELSGGMQQRVMIAMALAGEPELLILDEPTTNLDVTTEATILDLVRKLTTDKRTAVLYVSHNLGVVAQLCDRVAVLYAGELLEDADTKALYQKSYHPYTLALLGAVPRLGQQKTERRLTPIPGGIPPLDALPEGCIFAERCPVAVPECRSGRIPLVPFEGEVLRQSRCLRAAELAAGELQLPEPSAVATAVSAVAESRVVLKMSGLRKQFRVPQTLLDRLMGRPKRAVRAVDGVSLRLKQAQTLGLVGESGSGKSTLARLIVGLYPYDEGELELLSVPLKRELAARDKAALKRLQMVFQSSEEALNPYRTVGDILRRPFRKLAGMRYAEADAAARKLLAAVKLSEGYLVRLPGELSGGERQRVAIARAFATEPELLILDESVSGLDVSVQAAILNLLAELQLERGVSYLFVSHDLAAVSYLADRIAVLYLGHLMQVAATGELLNPPYHPYTEALLSAIPLAKPQPHAWSVRLKGEIPSPTDIPSGCRFHSRCPRYLGDICRTQEPPWQTTADGGRIYCHIPLDELKALQTPLVGERDAELSP
jgi:peptide/nickel transport system ATP-binding protein